MAEVREGMRLGEYPRAFDRVQRVLPAVLGLLALLVPGSYSASVQKSNIDGLVKTPVIDKSDVRFDPLLVGGVAFKKRVLALAQDKYGFVWLGTDEGLYRYDGYTLKPYRHDPNNPRSLSDSTVLFIYTDRAGILWIGTGYAGLDRFDPAQDVFTHYRHDPHDSRSLRNDHVNLVYQDRAGSLWIGTSDGLDRMDISSGSFFHYPHPSDSPSAYAIWGLYEDRQGNFLVGCAQGLYKLERENRFSRFSNSPTGLDQDVEWFAQDHSGALWFTSDKNNIGALNTTTGESRRYAFNWEDSSTDHRFASVFEDRNGVVWIGTVRDGLFKLDKERKNFFRYQMGLESGMHGQIWVLLEDSEGNMWVGSEAGVVRFRTSPPAFANYQHEPRNPNSLASNKVFSVHTDVQGFVWIGTEAGLQRLDRKTGQIILYQHDPRNPNSRSFSAVNAIEEDGAGGLWIGTSGGGLNHFDRTSGRFVAYRHNLKNPQSLSSDLIDCVLVEPGGVLCLCDSEP